MRRGRLCGVAVAVCVVGLGLVSTANARSHVRMLVFHPAYHRLPFKLISGSYLLQDGRFVVLEDVPAAGQDTVLDDETGARTTVTLPLGDCGSVKIGGGWLAFDCGDRGLALYSMSSGAWRSLSPPGATACSSPSPSSPCWSMVGVGARWVEYAYSCYHCGTTVGFQNIETGRTGAPSPRPGPRRVLDLSAPTLTNRLCEPLTVPREGSIELFGAFAVTESADPPEAYLGRCRSHLHKPVGWPVVGNPSVLMWSASTPSDPFVYGIFPRRLLRFRVASPPNTPRGPEALAVAARHLYMVDDSGVLWSATELTAPQSSKSHDGH